MDLENVKKLIIGTWDMYYQPIDNGYVITTFGGQDQYTFDNDYESHKGNHASALYKVPYSIIKEQDKIILKGKKEKEILAISQKCMVWQEDSVIYTLLCKS